MVRELRLAAFVFFRVYANLPNISCTYAIYTLKFSQEPKLKRKYDFGPTLSRKCSHLNIDSFVEQVALRLQVCSTFKGQMYRQNFGRVYVENIKISVYVKSPHHFNFFLRVYTNLKLKFNVLNVIYTKIKYSTHITFRP